MTLLEALKSKSIALLLEEEGDEEEGDEEEPEEEGDEEEPEEEGNEEEPEEEEPPIETSIEDMIRLEKSFDSELEAVFNDFEVRARKSAALGIDESRMLTIAGILKEESDYEEKFDIDQFAADTARLIKNYTTLLDVEAIIYNKAKQFITDKYDKETAGKLKDILITRHGVDFMVDDEPFIEEPIAVVGSSGGGGGI
jgi:hypothetical protein